MRTWGRESKRQGQNDSYLNDLDTVISLCEITADTQVQISGNCIRKTCWSVGRGYLWEKGATLRQLLDPVLGETDWFSSFSLAWPPTLLSLQAQL